eukprot:s1141_g40.t9
MVHSVKTLWHFGPRTFNTKFAMRDAQFEELNHTNGVVSAWVHGAPRGGSLVYNPCGPMPWNNHKRILVFFTGIFNLTLDMDNLMFNLSTPGSSRNFWPRALGSDCRGPQDVHDSDFVGGYPVRLVRQGRYLHHWLIVNASCADSTASLEFRIWRTCVDVHLIGDQPQFSGNFQESSGRTGYGGSYAALGFCCSGPRCDLIDATIPFDCCPLGESSCGFGPSKRCPLPLRTNKLVIPKPLVVDETGAHLHPWGDGHAWHVPLTGRHEAFQVVLANPNHETADVRIIFHLDDPSKITGVATLLRNISNKKPSGLHLQLSKNWHINDCYWGRIRHDGVWYSAVVTCLGRCPFAMQRRLSQASVDYISESISSSRWSSVGGYQVEFTPWAFFLIDTIASQGFLPGILTDNLSFGLLVQRFRCHWVHFMMVAFPRLQEHNAASHGASFGLSKLTAFRMHLTPRVEKWLCTSEIDFQWVELSVPPSTQLQAELLVIYQFFGNLHSVSHAQLSLIGWPGSNGLWEEVGLGADGESISYEPNMQQRRSMVLDTRPFLVCMMDSPECHCFKEVNASGTFAEMRCEWKKAQHKCRGDFETTGWTENHGGSDFLVAINETGSYQYLTNVTSWHISNGPRFTNASYHGLTADGAVKVKREVSTWATRDVARHLHSFRYEVLRNMTYPRFALYVLGADWYNFVADPDIVYGDLEGLIGMAVNQSASLQRFEYSEQWKDIPCQLPCWFAMLTKGSQETHHAHRGLLLRSFSASGQLGGDRLLGYVAMRFHVNIQRHRMI